MEQLAAAEANPVVAALDAFTQQGNQFALQLEQLSADLKGLQQAAALRSLRNSCQEVTDLHTLEIDLGLPPRVTISRLYQGMRGSSSVVLIDVRGTNTTDLLCAHTPGGLGMLEQQSWLADKLQQARGICNRLHLDASWIDAQEADLGVVRRQTTERLSPLLLYPALGVHGIVSFADMQEGMCFIPAQTNLPLFAAGEIPSPASMLRKCIRLVPDAQDRPLFFDEWLARVLPALQLSSPQRIEVAVVDLSPIDLVSRTATSNLNLAIRVNFWWRIKDFRPALRQFVQSLPPSIAHRVFPHIGSLRIIMGPDLH